MNTEQQSTRSVQAAARFEALRHGVVAATLLVVLAILLPAATVAAGQFEVKSVLLKDLNRDVILYEQQPDRLIAPASLTKLMTLYLVWDEIKAGRAKLTDRVKISARAAGTGGSSMNIVAGERVTLKEMIKGMAVSSGNDACVAIAEHFGGEAAFVKKMNKKARALGLKHTTFKNPHGLPATGQLTTAREMMLLAESYLKAYPDSLNIHSLRSYTHNKIRRRNSNRLLGACAGVDGLKTGYVRASGFNIVVTAKRDGVRLLAVVLGGQTSSIRNREATKIVDMGFNMLDEPEYQLADLQTKPLEPGIYCIQESSWRSPDKAQNHAAGLRAKGIPAQVVRADLGPKGIWSRVLIGGYAKRSEAERARRLLVRKLDRQDPFIRKVDSEMFVKTSDARM